MSIGDSIRRFFSKKSNPQLRELAGFAAERKGVEGFIEPRTATSPTTLLFVDRDGDHLRAPVREPQDAVAFCDRIGVPVYDASVIGYPRRMRDFDDRRRRRDPEVIDKEIADLERRLSETDPNIPDQ